MIEKSRAFCDTARIALVLTVFLRALNAGSIVFFESSLVLVAVATGACMARYTAQIDSVIC
jgi:hypothetical protein